MADTPQLFTCLEIRQWAEFAAAALRPTVAQVKVGNEQGSRFSKPNRAGGMGGNLWK